MKERTTLGAQSARTEWIWRQETPGTRPHAFNMTESPKGPKERARVGAVYYGIGVDVFALILPSYNPRSFADRLIDKRFCRCADLGAEPHEAPYLEYSVSVAAWPTAARPPHLTDLQLHGSGGQPPCPSRPYKHRSTLGKSAGSRLDSYFTYLSIF